VRILVTGGAGFIASHLVDKLIADGHHVAVVDSLVHGSRDHIRDDCTFYEMDVCDEGLRDVFDRERPDVVSHHAAQVDVARSTADPLWDATVNVLGSVNVFRQAAQIGVSKVIYVSTGGAVYGEPDYVPVDEKHLIHPKCEYGASKYSAELYLAIYGENYNMDYTILRYPNVYGPRQRSDGEAGVISIFASRMLRGEPCTINGDGSQERDFVYVEDCVRANLMVLGSAGSRRTYNLGWGVPTSVDSLFRSLARITGYEAEPEYGPQRLGETHSIYLDATRASTELGWTPLVALDDGLERTVAALRD